MKRKIKAKSLRTKIIAWSFIPSGIILFIATIVILFAFQKTTEQLAIEQDIELTYLIANKFSRDVQGFIEPFIALSRLPELAYDDPKMQQEVLAMHSQQFMLGATEAEFGLVLLDITGEVILAEPAQLAQSGEDWSARSYYTHVVQSLANNEPIHPTFSNVVNHGIDEQAVIVGAMPVLGEQSMFRGVLLMVIPIDGINQFDLIENQEINSLRAIIVDGNGRVLYHSDKQHIGEDFSAQEAVHKVLQGGIGAIRTRDVDGQFIVAGHATIPDTPWGLVTEASWKELHSHSQGYRIITVFLLLIAGLVPLTSINAGSKKIIKPISRLMHAVDGVASGNFDQITTINTGDEIEELAEQFNVMAAKLRESYASLEQKVADRTRELETLNAVAAIVSRSLDLDETLSEVLRKVLTRLNMDAGCIHLISTDGQTLLLHAHQGLTGEFVTAAQHINVGEGLVGQVVAQKQLIVMDIAEYANERLVPLLRAANIQTLAGIPIMSKGQIVGTLTLASVKQHTLSEEEQTLIAAVGQQISVGVENARAEQELRESEARYRDLFNHSPVGIFRTAADGVIVDANPTLMQLLDFDSVEAGNEVGLANLYADSEDRIELLRQIQQGPVTNFETRFRRGDGKIIFVSIRANLTYDEADQPEFIQGTLIDITEKKHAEQALRESQERLQLAIEGAGLGLWDLNLLTGEQVMNYDWWEKLGYTPDEKGTNFEDIAQLVHPDDRGKMADAFNNHLSGQVPLYDVEFRVRAKSGEWRWVHFQGKIVAFDEQNKPLRMAGISQDVTDRKHAEQALRESEERIKVAMEAAGLGLWDRNLETQEMVIAHYGSEVPISCCYDDGDAEFEQLEEWIHPDDKHKREQALNAHLSGEAPLYEVEFRVPGSAPDEWTWQLQRGRIVAWGDNDKPLRMTGIHEDITARKRGEEELRQAKEAAETANRAKSVFLANMSHELRTPLNAILGFTQLMVRDSKLTETQRDNLSTISRSGQHLLTLINDVLEMSKIEAGRTTLYLENFDLDRLLDAMEDMFYLRASEKGLHLLVERDPGVPRYIRSDESKLRQVLMNLLSNAIKFTEEGGVTLRVKSEELEIRNEGRPHPTPHNSQPITLYFEVEDTGYGIGAEDMVSLFDPFVQTSSGQESKEGTGLGLPISQEYVHLMEGEMTVSSELGHGSIFRFDIQATVAEITETVPERNRGQILGLEPGQPTYRLLIAEDKWTNRQLLVEFLKPLGFEIREALNGQEAIEIWEEWHPHLIWMDMRMPVMDGHEATKRIKATSKGQATVIVALTASAFEEDRKLILSEGCDDFVRKPFREAEIYDVLERNLGIRFIYEEPASEIVEDQDGEVVLNRKTVATLPEAWRTALYEAAIAADTDRISQIVQQIRTRNSALASALENLVYEFRFDIIMELTQQT